MEIYIAVIAAGSSIFGVAAGGIVTYLLQKQRFKQEMQLKQDEFKQEMLLKREENKTENSAEDTIKYYLQDKDEDHRYERSFEHLKTKLGGFQEEDLRKILVRAGAVRFFREDRSEWWCLVSRLPEKYKKDRAGEEKLKAKRVLSESN